MFIASVVLILEMLLNLQNNFRDVEGIYRTCAWFFLVVSSISVGFFNAEKRVQKATDEDTARQQEQILSSPGLHTILMALSLENKES